MEMGHLNRKIILYFCIALLGFMRHFFYLLIDLFYFKMVRLVCPEA